MGMMNSRLIPLTDDIEVAFQTYTTQFSSYCSQILHKELSQFSTLSISELITAVDNRSVLPPVKNVLQVTKELEDLKLLVQQQF